MCDEKDQKDSGSDLGKCRQVGDARQKTKQQR